MLIFNYILGYLIYCYFSNYSLDKLQKQVKQVNMNKRTSIKNDIMI